MTEADALDELVTLLDATSLNVLTKHRAPENDDVIVLPTGGTPEEWQFSITAYAIGGDFTENQVHVRAQRADIEAALGVRFVWASYDYGVIENADWFVRFEVGRGRL